MAIDRESGIGRAGGVHRRQAQPIERGDWSKSVPRPSRWFAGVLVLLLGGLTLLGCDKSDATKTETTQVPAQSSAPSSAPPLQKGAYETPPPTGQKPPKPYAIVGRDDSLTPVQDALNAGDVDRATSLLYLPSITEERRQRPDGKALIAAIQSESDRQIGLDAGSEEASRIKLDWQPTLDAIPTRVPESVDDLWKRVSDFEEAARQLEETANIQLKPPERQLRDHFKASIIAKQRLLFPVLRRAYGQIIIPSMSDMGISGRVGGAGNRAVTWTAAAFVNQVEIETAQRGMSPNLTKLRFTRSAYEWARGIGGVYTYSMRPPSDDVIGYWEGFVFKPVQ